jgi:large subunit ribosomal protein L1
MKLSKNKKKQIEGINFNKSYSVLDAVNILKEKKYSKFDESIEVSINTGIDSKQSDQNVRGSFVPPHGLGKKSTDCSFCTRQSSRRS